MSFYLAGKLKLDGMKSFLDFRQRFRWNNMIAELVKAKNNAEISANFQNMAAPPSDWKRKKHFLFLSLLRLYVTSKSTKKKLVCSRLSPNLSNLAVLANNEIPRFSCTLSPTPVQWTWDGWLDWAAVSQMTHFGRKSISSVWWLCTFTKVLADMIARLSWAICSSAGPNRIINE